jgi:hypothetical protein
MEAHMRLLEIDPGMRERRAEIHALTSRLIADGASSRRMRGAPITIPVVVHVVYKNAAENISAAQIATQMNALNRDFSAGNLDRATCPPVWTGLIADAQIRFVLATKDPRGKTTTGITRIRDERERVFDQRRRSSIAPVADKTRGLQTSTSTCGSARSPEACWGTRSFPEARPPQTAS